MTRQNQYDKDKHNEYILCPRCDSRNAPAKSDEFKPECWNCGEHLGHQPVEVGEEYTIDITDLHERGAGVGHTEDGFVILVDGVLPPKTVHIEVTNVKSSYALGDLIEVISDEDPENSNEKPESDTEEKDEERLGARGDWWG